MLLLSWLLFLISICHTNADADSWSISFTTMTASSDKYEYCCGISFNNFGNLSNENCIVAFPGNASPCEGLTWCGGKYQTNVCELVDWDQDQKSYSIITGPDYSPPPYNPNLQGSTACSFPSNVTLWPPVKANEYEAYVGVYMDDFDVGCPLGTGIDTMKDGLACNTTYSPPSAS